MKAFTLFLLLIRLAGPLFAQSERFAWGKQLGGGASAYVSAIASDAVGNVYTTGSFTGSVDFDPGPGTFTLTAATVAGAGPGEDVFVCKLTAAGELVWAKQIGGNGYYTLSTSIAIDRRGHVYTTGSFFGGPVDFDPGPGTYTLDPGYEDMFISHLDACGDFISAYKVGGATGDRIRANDITIDSAGNIITTGRFTGTKIDFDTDAGIQIFPTTYNVERIFVHKLDPNEKFMWARQMEAMLDGPIIPDCAGTSVAIDPADNIYVTGYFGGKVDFDPGTARAFLSSAPNGSYILKLNALGNLSWVRQLEQLDEAAVIGHSIAVDVGGNVYCSGTFRGTIDFDPGSGNFPMVNNSPDLGNLDVYLASLNTQGVFRWAVQIGRIGELRYPKGYYVNKATGITMDRAGNVFLASAFRGTVDADPGIGINNLTSVGDQDLLLARFTSEGKHTWAASIGGTATVLSNAIALDRWGSILTGGMFWGGNIDTDPGPNSDIQSPMGDVDMFVHKMKVCTNSPSSSILTVRRCGSYELNCKTYTASGTYHQVLANASGCDSTITLQLTIDASPSSLVTASACRAYDWRGKRYTTSGRYQDTVKNLTGCDSIISLQLTIKPTATTDQYIAICQGQSYRGYTKSGSYTDTLRAANGCDSLLRIRLTVSAVPLIDLGADQQICPGDSIVLKPGKFISYRWQDGSTDSLFIARQTGLYTVVASGPCGIARDDIRITPGICSVYFPTAFTPNQDGKNDMFTILGITSLSEYQLVVYDRWGKKIFETSDVKKGWTGTANGVNHPAGVYIWTCNYRQHSSAEKIVLRGSITLIR